jgi:hypothetical protein
MRGSMLTLPGLSVKTGSFEENPALFLLRVLFGITIETRCAAPNYELIQPFPSVTER